MCLHHQRGTFGDGVNDGERRLRKDEESEKGGIDGEVRAEVQGEGDEKGAVWRGEGGKPLSFSESRTTEMAVQLMNPPYLHSSQPLWVFSPSL